MQTTNDVLPIKGQRADVHLHVRITSYKTGESFLITRITAVRGYLTDRMESYIGRSFKDKKILTDIIKKALN